MLGGVDEVVEAHLTSLNFNAHGGGVALLGGVDEVVANLFAHDSAARGRQPSV